MIIQKLKLILKNRNLTYRDLAKQLDMSESGLKKFLQSKDGSLARLAQISKLLGISLADLIEDNTWEVYPVQFTEAQQKTFLAEPLVFEFYWKLVYERQSLDMITDKKHLSQAMVNQILRTLDRLNLIQWGPGGKIRVPDVVPITWVGDGPFIRQIFRNWSQSFVESLAAPERSSNSHFHFRYLQATEETYAALIRSQRELEMKFLKQAIREMQMGLSNLKHVRWLAAIDDRSFYKN